MRFFIFFVIGLALVAVVHCQQKRGKPNNCPLACPANYSPVCANDLSVKGGRPRTFANRCVMGVHNCEHKAQMEVLYDGECKGSGGVRLS